MSETIRPTKKQKELLAFIEKFIAENGYSPSYREIMKGLEYSSVATVALHVSSLIARGQLRKRNRSARSLEVVESSEPAKITTNQIKPAEEKWLIEKIEHFFKQVEQAVEVNQAKVDELYVLVGTLKVFSLNGAAESFMSRISQINEKISTK